MKLRVKIPKYENAIYGTFKEGDIFEVPDEDADRYLESGALEKVTKKNRKRR